MPSLVALSLAGAAAALTSSGLAAKLARDPAPAIIRTALPVQAADELARRRLVYLSARSATMQQLMEVLEMTPEISVRLRANSMLWREARRKAMGRFWREGAQVVALLQFDSGATGPIEQLEWVAHEMAHALELACLPAAIETGRLRTELLRRGRVASDLPGPGIETPFAEDAGRRIFVEALRGRLGIGRLKELAGKHNLGPPCADFAAKSSAVPAYHLRVSPPPQ
jgi:hypothetical protein